MTPGASAEVTAAVEGRQLTLSNLDKVLYPEAGFSKAQVIDYYRRIAPALLPHLSDRPLTLKRYPDGVDRGYFYEKQCPRHRPDWVQTTDVWSGRNNRNIAFCLANDLPTLVWVANLASLELHTSLARSSDLTRPTMVVFDLDPGAPAAVLECAQVATWLRQLLTELGLAAQVKTSGSKGLQLYVALNTPVTYEETKGFARSLAQLLERRHPAQVVSLMKKELRRGKVFIDWSQNDEHKTTVCVYSLRALPRPTVSTPLHWDEVDAALSASDPGLLRFEADQVVARVEQHGDLFAGLVEREQILPAPPAT